MWMPVNTGRNVDDRMAIELHFLSRSGQAWEWHGGVSEHAIAESRGCLLKIPHLFNTIMYEYFENSVTVFYYGFGEHW